MKVSGRARRVGGGLGGAGPVQVMLREVGLDVLAPLREATQSNVGDAGDVGDAIGDGSPVDAEPAGQFGAELCLVEVADGLGPRVEGPGVQRRPPVIGDGVDEVGDHDVGVYLWVPGPGGAVTERGGDEAVGGDALLAAFAPTGPGGLGLEHRQGRADCGVMSVADLVRGLWVAEGEEQRNRLRSRERGVEAWDGHCTMGAGEALPGSWVTGGEDPMERGRVDLSAELELCRRGAHPLTG